MSSRPRHKCSDVEKVLRRMERASWTVVYPSGHWGRVECGDGCRRPVAGTPRDCGDLAKQLRRLGQGCRHGHCIA